jgi:three-Cys-motif partner protein
VLLEEIKEIIYIQKAQKRNVKQIHCHFNDMNPAKVTTLLTEITQRGFPKTPNLTITTGSNNYSSVLNTVVPVTKKPKSKTFVFIDPFSYKEIKMTDIQELLNSGQSEVLIWLPFNHIYRIKYNSKTENINPFLNQIYTFEELQSIAATVEKVWDFAEEVKQKLQSIVGDKYFVDSFNIKKDKTTLYCMFFFTPHIKGFQKMLEAKWKIDEQHGEGWHFLDSKIKHNLFNSPEIKSQFWVNKLKKYLEDFLRQKDRTNSELFIHILRLGFLPKHAGSILKEWRKSGKISVYLADGNTTKSGLYLNYKCYKNSPNKVTFKIK